MKFGLQKDYGYWEYIQPDAEEIAFFSNTFFQMTNTGYISPERIDDMNFVRDKIGLPILGPDEFKNIRTGLKEETQDQKSVASAPVPIIDRSGTPLGEWPSGDMIPRAGLNSGDNPWQAEPPSPMQPYLPGGMKGFSRENFNPGI